ncbi:hypothetical protein ACUXFI_002322 [Staphylococcus epidermidis]|uniref:hypothetical protein n=1 Tax=Staphylococcus epidermidis TaxID=1282 RepID=UPI00119FF9BE|nr:hypothetical protein [Staphylococcus epidermidis]MCG1310994.1 hypothetical protein [Staphylococcus epidermidis]MCG1995290.1 hypothetical protein [Staphylococcus epidermidis]
MSKIKQTDITKLSHLEQKIEQLKERKKKQEAQLSNKIGEYFLNELDLDTIDSSDELYKIMDKVIEEFKNIKQNSSNGKNEINQNNINKFSDDVRE